MLKYDLFRFVVPKKKRAFQKISWPIQNYTHWNLSLYCTIFGQFRPIPHSIATNSNRYCLISLLIWTYAA